MEFLTEGKFGGVHSKRTIQISAKVDPPKTYSLRYPASFLYTYAPTHFIHSTPFKNS